LNYHIGRIVLGSMCVGVSVWLGWSGIRVAGFSLQHGPGENCFGNTSSGLNYLSQYSVLYEEGNSH